MVNTWVPQQFAVAIVLYALQTPAALGSDQARTTEWRGFRKSVDPYLGEFYRRKLRWLTICTDQAKVSTFITLLLEHWDGEMNQRGVADLVVLLQERAP